MKNKVPAKYVVIYDNYRDNFQECCYIRGFEGVFTPEKELKDTIALLKRSQHKNIRVWEKAADGRTDVREIKLSEIK